MIDGRRKMSKLHCLKLPKISPRKRKLEQKINDSRPHNLTFNFRFSSRISQSQQKLSKSITHFTVYFCSKTPTYFMRLNILNIVKNILLQHSQKPTHFTNFSRNLFLVGARKNIYSAPFLDAQELHSRRNGKADISISLYISIPAYLRKKMIVPESRMFLSGVCVCVYVCVCVCVCACLCNGSLIL